ncbi:MAG: PhaM family polyhydroxyalkanoate granule multifunctional regulatory protein [Burkholderiales bacterium]|nr:PhaM family polyhydroxyalkanoate granule multifunctional regulatory protein [Burkholderiales bacterium]
MSHKPGTPVTPQDYFELMQKMASPGGHSFQSLFFPPLDVKEIEKKIIELKSVEHWLQANLGMLKLSIQTLEYQKALLSPAKEDGKKAAGAAGDNAANPAIWAWQMMNQATEQFQAAAQQAMQSASTPAAQPAQNAKPKARASSRKRSS